MVFNFSYLLIFLLVFSSCGSIVARNPVVSILYLILVFLQASLLFILLGAEFLFVLLLIVYVGAIAILFIFVIMLLNLRVVESYNTFYSYIPIGLFVATYFILFILFLLINDFNFLTPLDFTLVDNFSKNWVSFLFFKSNIYSIGELLYNYYNNFFILAGLILLVALIGVITLIVTRTPYNPKKFFYNHKRVSQGSFASWF